MSLRSVNDALEQLEQLYMMRLLHQTLRDRLEQAQAAVNADTPPPPRLLMEIFRLPQQLEEMMLMRAITLSLNQVQPSSAPPPISASDAEHLERITLTCDIVKRLQRKDYRECPICQEEFATMTGSTAARLPCDHIFCVNCIRQWLDSSRTCPVCRLEVVEVENQYHGAVMKRELSLLAVTPPPTPPPRAQHVSKSHPIVCLKSKDDDDEASDIQPQPKLSSQDISSYSTSLVSPAPAPPTRPQQSSAIARSPYRQQSVGGASSNTAASSGNNSDSDGDEGVLPSVEQQALLDEILRRRDAQQQRTSIRTTDVPLTSVRQESRRTSGTIPTSSTVLTVGRPRPAQRTSTSGTVAVQPSRPSVGVRGVLNRSGSNGRVRQ